MALKTVFENENSRSAVYDEDKLIGECDFSRQGDHWVIYHTEVDPQYGGKGLAWDLVKCAADQAASENMKLECTCSYAAKALGSRQEYQSMLINQRELDENARFCGMRPPEKKDN